MLFILLWFGILKQTLCLFAPHMDLQKIDEIMFDNTKYTVLKPTIHITRDHFKDFIQQRDNRDFPGRKVFIDRDGFRHYWTGFEARRPKSLRKTVLQSNDIPHNEAKMTSGKTSETKNKDNKIDKEQQKINVTKKLEVIKKVKKGPLRKKKVSEPDDIDKTKEKLALREDGGKTKVKTTFFCPFFGVVTMISYID